MIRLLNVKITWRLLLHLHNNSTSESQSKSFLPMTFAVVDVLQDYHDYEPFSCHSHTHHSRFFHPSYVQKTTTRPSATTTITTRHQLNTNQAAKIEITAREIAVATIKNAKRTRRVITKPTAQVPRDRQAASFHRSARKAGIIRQAWTTSHWQQELSGQIIKVNFTLPFLLSV